MYKVIIGEEGTVSGYNFSQVIALKVVSGVIEGRSTCGLGSCLIRFSSFEIQAKQYANLVGKAAQKLGHCRTLCKSRRGSITFIMGTEGAVNLCSETMFSLQMTL